MEGNAVPEQSVFQRIQCDQAAAMQLPDFVSHDMTALVDASLLVQRGSLDQLTHNLGILFQNDHVIDIALSFTSMISSLPG